MQTFSDYDEIVQITNEVMNNPSYHPDIFTPNDDKNSDEPFIMTDDYYAINRVVMRIYNQRHGLDINNVAMNNNEVEVDEIVDDIMQEMGL